MTSNQLPLVSVVIATYNHGRFLRVAIDSVLSQTFSDFEIIVVDDGSTDDTREVMKPYQSDRRIKYIVSEHQGHAPTKNRCLAETTGEYIAFLDADDCWMPTKLEKQLKLFQANSILGVVFTRRNYIDQLGERIDLTEPRPYRGSVVRALFLDNFVCFSSAMVRKEIVQAIGNFDESLCYSIDYDFWLRASLKFEFDFVDEQLVSYRKHANMTNALQFRAKRNEIDRVVAKFLGENANRKILGRSIIRNHNLNRLCGIGYHFRSSSRISSILYYLRALLIYPFCAAAWPSVPL
jgi:glycosyltransferase involved in cell wall biosynthesis